MTLDEIRALTWKNVTFTDVYGEDFEKKGRGVIHRNYKYVDFAPPMVGNLYYSCQVDNWHRPYTAYSNFETIWDPFKPLTRGPRIIVAPKNAKEVPPEEPPEKLPDSPFLYVYIERDIIAPKGYRIIDYRVPKNGEKFLFPLSPKDIVNQYGGDGKPGDLRYIVKKL